MWFLQAQMTCLKLWNLNLTMSSSQVRINLIIKPLCDYLFNYWSYLGFCLSMPRKQRRGKQNCSGCSSHCHTCHPYFGWQEPVLCGPTLWNCHHRTTNRLGSFSQCWTEFGGSWLHPVPHGCQSTPNAGPEVLPNAVLRFWSQRVPQLWPHGQSRALQPHERHAVEIWQGGCGWASDRSREIYR